MLPRALPTAKQAEQLLGDARSLRQISKILTDLYYYYGGDLQRLNRHEHGIDKHSLLACVTEAMLRCEKEYLASGDATLSELVFAFQEMNVPVVDIVHDTRYGVDAQQTGLRLASALTKCKVPLLWSDGSTESLVSGGALQHRVQLFIDSNAAGRHLLLELCEPLLRCVWSPDQSQVHLKLTQRGLILLDYKRHRSDMDVAGHAVHLHSVGLRVVTQYTPRMPDFVQDTAWGAHSRSLPVDMTLHAHSGRLTQMRPVLSP